MMGKNLIKRLFVLLMVFVLLFSIVGCATEQNQNNNKDNQNNNNAATDNTKSEYTNKDLNEQLVMAGVWYQKSAEMRALSYQAFNMAKLLFDQDKKNNTSDQKRAVIVDIDETVLDNSPYEVGLVGDNRGYPDKWGDWLNAAKAKALPGSVEFLTYVVNNGGDVYYISNRKEEYKDATIKNLKDLNFPQVDEEHVLLRTETSDKEPRRKSVRDNHRIVVLMGDNLNDFDTAFAGKGVDERFGVTDQNKDKFGKSFIVLPNPLYGEWEGAVYDYDWGKSPKEKSDARKGAFNPWP